MGNNRSSGKVQVPVKGATLGADLAFDTQDFMANLQAADIVPHLAENPTARRGGAAPDAYRSHSRRYEGSRFLQRDRAAAYGQAA